MKMGDRNDQRKRVRVDSGELDADLPETKVARVDWDSEVDSSESQLTRTNSGESCVDSEGFELARDDSETPPLNSPEAREIQDDLLNILDDSDNVGERDPTMQGLDSVIKSFEEEILAPGPDAVAPNPTPESCNLQPNLGYLLEASDDELGLPPTVTPTEEGKPENENFSRVGPDGIDLTGFLGFEDDIPDYECVGFGAGVFVECGGDEDDGGYVTLDGLFDYAEPGDILWRSESLQAM